MYLHVSECMCLSRYASHSREVKARIPYSSGAGRRGFDPRGVHCFPLSHSGQTAADSSRGPYWAPQAPAAPCSTSTLGPWSGPMITRLLPPEKLVWIKQILCELASHGLPESSLACKYNCTGSKKLSYRKYCKIVARYCQIDCACCLNLPNNDKYLWYLLINLCRYHIPIDTFEYLLIVFVGTRILLSYL
jgi:hypothetical protein